MLTPYDYLPSQNAYKVRLLLHHLDRPYRQVFERVRAQPGFLAATFPCSIDPHSVCELP